MPCCDQGGGGGVEDHDLIVSKTFTFDDTLLDKYDESSLVEKSCSGHSLIFLRITFF